MTEQDLIEEIPTIDGRIRICVNCGSVMVIVNENIMSCKSCNKQFKIKGDIHGICL